MPALEVPCMAQSSSIIIACEFKNGVIIGSDSQHSSGDYIKNRTANKIIKLNDRIYCSGSGPEAIIQFLIDNAIYQLQALKLNAEDLTVVAAASIFRKSCRYHNIDFLIAGWDNIYGGQVYSISSGGMMKRESQCAIGSGSLYVYGYIDASYNANMNKEEAMEFVLKTVNLAISRDNMSGGCTYVIVITNSDVE